MRGRGRWLTAAAGVAAVEATLIHLGRTYGSTTAERSQRLPGDELIADASVQTDHAITIDAEPAAVWPWLVQMGWGRGGLYTPRWVDRLLFPANGPSADRIHPEWLDLDVGGFVPDGPPETECGFAVAGLEKQRALVLRSNSHLPAAWRRRATLDWTWAFVLTATDDGRTRFHFRSRWRVHPWWLTLGSWAVVVPADFVMGRAMLRGVGSRAATGR
jgi:hypothetical protein